MTAQPIELVDTFADTDIEFPIQCEHSEHGGINIRHDAGPATHYIRTVECPKCGDPSVIYAACAQFTKWVTNRPDAPITCLRCSHIEPVWDCLTVLGPVCSTK